MATNKKILEAAKKLFSRKRWEVSFIRKGSAIVGCSVRSPGQHSRKMSPDELVEAADNLASPSQTRLQAIDERQQALAK